MLVINKTKFTEYHRCAEGQRLYNAWTDAMETHDPDTIHDAAKTYFYHVNGLLEGRPCFECGPLFRERKVG